ncbi:uncharacterized protein LOC103316768 [Nasonia vitripennis]|uniref:Uncharacterized protein n=1 Tax=Nasonia vitripennis TaxID=7425 RepID=A0A7M7QAC2_NASVI|nr:uncharacterized protein LOC103316768 [Nasonia vitripennis]
MRRVVRYWGAEAMNEEEVDDCLESLRQESKKELDIFHSLQSRAGSSEAETFLPRLVLMCNLIAAVLSQLLDVFIKCEKNVTKRRKSVTKFEERLHCRNEITMMNYLVSILFSAEMTVIPAVLNYSLSLNKLGPNFYSSYCSTATVNVQVFLFVSPTYSGMQCQNSAEIVNGVLGFFKSICHVAFLTSILGTALFYTSSLLTMIDVFLDVTRIFLRRVDQFESLYSMTMVICIFVT